MAEDAVGEDCLLEYRKYVKDKDITGWVCLFHEQCKNTQFYRKNPFFNVDIVLNDDAFLAMCSLPI